MTLRLRPHHLLCLLTYVGKGYSPAFVANLDDIAARAAAGEEILLVEGPDDICAPLTAEASRNTSAEEEPHCLRDSVRRRDALAAMALGDLLGRPLSAGAKMTLTAETKRRLRDAFRAGGIRAACSGCEWHDLCSTVAGEAFDRSRLI